MIALAPSGAFDLAGIAAALVRASLEGGVLALAVWLICRTFRRLPAGVVAALWWAVCLKLVLALVWWAPTELAVLPPGLADNAWAGRLGLASTQIAADVAAPGATAEPQAERIGGGNLVAAERQAALRATPGSEPPTADPAPLSDRTVGRRADGAGAPDARSGPSLLLVVLFALWLLGLLVTAVRVVRGYRNLERLLAAAHPVDDPRVTAKLGRLAERLGVRTPRLLVSAAAPSPLVAGLVRPAVVIPPSALESAAEPELELLLAHELIHLRRADLWLGLVPAAARALFFFHPLAALAAREYLLAREAACDAEVLSRLAAAPRAYGRLLLRWGVARARLATAAPAAARTHLQLERRLLMLHDAALTRRPRRLLMLAIAVAVTIALLPLHLVAAPAVPDAGAGAPTLRDTAYQVAGGSRGTGTATSTTAVSTTGVSSTTGTGSSSSSSSSSASAATAVGDGPAEAAGYALAAAPSAVAVDQKPTRGRRETSHSYYSYSVDQGSDGYAVVSGDHSTSFHLPWEEFERYRREHASSEPAFWISRDGQSYVVTDPEIVAEATKIIAPVQELGSKQGDLGGQQGELGGKQAALGSQQGELGSEQGRLGMRLGELTREQVRLSMEGGGGEVRAARRERIAELRHEIDAISDRMQELGDRQRELGERQRELGQRQGAMGKVQAELGRQQSEASRVAEGQLSALADRAFAQGKVREID